MPHVVFRDHPIIARNSISFDIHEGTTAKQLVTVLMCEDKQLWCKVNGKIPDLINDDYVFPKGSFIEIAPIVTGGNRSGGNKALAAVLTVAVVVASIYTGGAAGAAFFGSATAAQIAAAAVVIGGTLLVNSLVPVDPPQGLAVPSTPSIDNSLNDVSVSSARNPNPINQPMCLPLGYCCRVVPPHGMQPYSTLENAQESVERFDFFWVKNDDPENFPCAKVCFQYQPSHVSTIDGYYNYTNQSPSGNIWETWVGPFHPIGGPNDLGWFGPKRTNVNYPYEFSPMFTDRFYSSGASTGNGTAIQVRKIPCVSPNTLYGGPVFSNPNSRDIFLQAAGAGPACQLNGQNSSNPTLWSDYLINENGISQGVAIVASPFYTKGQGTTGIGLEGFSGFRFQCWVVLCDPSDPFFGHYVRLDALEAAGWDPANIVDPDVLIDGNPTLDVDGEIESMEPFCDVNAEFCVKERINTIKKVNKIHQVFHYGYGDLKIEESFFGTTPTSELVSFEETINEKFEDDWPLPENNCAYPRVDTTPGGQLFHNDLAQGPAPDPEVIVPVTDLNKYNWITRCGISKTNRIIILITAQMWRNGGASGVLGHNEQIQIQYRPYNSTGNWTNLGAGVFTLQSYDQSPVREEFDTGPITEDKYCVRVRRVTLQNKLPNVSSEITFSEVKWFQSDCKANTKNNEIVPTRYRGQNRVSTCLIATGQTSGVLGNYNAKVSTNVWMFDVQKFKDTGECDWTWDCEAGDSRSNNPAFMFLYFLRGGYCNTSANPDIDPSAEPLDGGYTDYGWHNGEHPKNEELWWGAGVKEKRIDLDCIKDWACWCEEQDLCFDYNICGEDKKVSDILNVIARAGRASYSLQNGKFCPIWEETNQPAVTIFSEENIIRNSFQVCYNSRSNYDRVTVTYTSGNEELGDDKKDGDFDGKPVQVTSPVPFSKERGDEKRVNLIGVRKRKQALREANLIAGKEYYNKRTYSWDTDIQHLCVVRGDIVILANDLTQSTFSARLTGFECSNGKVTFLDLNWKIDKDITTIQIRLLTGELISADVVKVSNKKLRLVTEVDASKFPIFKNETECNPANLTTKKYGEHPFDIMIIGSPLDTPGKRVRITDIQVRDICKASITAVDDELAVYAYEFHCCPDPVELEDEELKNFACPEVCGVTVEDCGQGLAKVCFSKKEAIAVTIQYSINGSEYVNFLSNGQHTISQECVMIQGEAGKSLAIKIMPFTVGEPFINNDYCLNTRLS